MGVVAVLHEERDGLFVRQRELLAGGKAKDSYYGGMTPSIKSGYRWNTNLNYSLAMRSPDNTMSPFENDLMRDKYAPRAFADYSSGMSGTFQQVCTKGSYVGSPPRSRDKYVITYDKIIYQPY